jgi:hypothetical protein
MTDKEPCPHCGCTDQDHGKELARLQVVVDAAVEWNLGRMPDNILYAIIDDFVDAEQAKGDNDG